jgi:hypothetical protein
MASTQRPARHSPFAIRNLHHTQKGRTFMPKPSRRERRQLAEKGQSAARRVVPDIPLTAKPATIAAEPTRATSLTSRVQEKVAALADAKEYAHIRGDLARIAILATLLIGAMFALWFYLPH